MNGSRRAVALAASTAIALFAATARAGDADHAQALFDEAVRLMEDGRYDEACPKLEESDGLDPGGGTALDLAHCFEQIGRVGRAYDAYVVARERAVADGRAERQRLAESRLAALAPSVARVRLATRTSLEGAIVLVDGRRTPLDAGGAFHIERGAHVLVVRAPSRAPWTRRIDAGADGDVEVEVEVEPPHAEPPPRTAPRPPAAPPEPARNGRRTASFVVGGAGLASIGVGLVLGTMAFGRHAESDRECPSGACSERGVEAEHEAARFALGADIGIAVGAVALGAATWLFFTAPRARTTALVEF